MLSNSATSAYQKPMVNNVPQGLIYTGEKWLHSLINLQLQNRQSFASQSARDTLIKTIGMEGDRWFSYILLGLMKISPRIALILENIANKAPEESVKNLKHPFNIKDILGENKSLQR